MDDPFKPGPGRKPPPVEHQFLKGTSGNKKGRPKGSVDLKKLTRKVALKKHAVKVDGKIVRKTLLQLVIESTAREAAAGVPSMVCIRLGISVSFIRTVRAPPTPRSSAVMDSPFLFVPMTMRPSRSDSSAISETKRVRPTSSSAKSCRRSVCAAP